MSSIFQKSFSSGEVCPSIYARCDLLKFATGLRTARNGFIARHGGFYNRQGTIYRSVASDSTHRVRLIPFSLSNDRNFQLEFGNLYVRILQDGVPVQTTLKDIQVITKAANAIITVKEFQSMLPGDQVTFAGVTGMTQINGLTGTIVSVISAVQFSVNIDSTGFSTYTGSGTVTPVTPRDIKYVTPYTEAMLREFTFSQSDQTLITAHQSGLPIQITYGAPESWSVIQSTNLVVPAIGKATITSGPSSAWTFFLSAASNATVGATYTIGGQTFTVAVTIAAQTVLVATNTVPPPTSGVLTKSGGTGDATITYVAMQNNAFQGLYFGITAIAQDTFEESLIATWGVANGVAAPWILTWGAVSGAIQYNIYRGASVGSLGFLDTTSNLTYTDDGTTLKPDYTSPPPIERIIFADAGSGGPGSMLPAAVGYFQQRRFWGNMGPPNVALGIPPTLPLFPNFSDRVFASRIGTPTFFNQQRPPPDDGQLSFRMINKIPQEIRHFLDIGKMCVFTAQGEWVLGGDPSSGGITPSAINPTNVSQNGSGFLAPLAIGSTALYTQFNKLLNTSIIRTFGFQFQVEGYRGDDVTIYSSHLTDGHQLYASAFQKLPHPIAWYVRDDGILLGMTFVPEQALLAWHRHDFTNGFVEDVMTSGDQVYMVIKRTINGSTVRSIERMATRSYASISDAIFVDSCTTFDGRNTDPTKTMTLTGGSTWSSDETLTLTSSAAFFSGASVGRFIHLRDANNSLVRLKITAQSSANVVSVQADRTVNPLFQGFAISNWTDARVIATGLSHLEGQTVSVLGDGFVVSSPNNPDYPTLTVTGGQITLSDGSVGYGVIQVGLPITTDLETLNIDSPQGPTMMNQKKNITKVLMWMEASRGCFVGSSAPDDDNPDQLSGLMPRLDELKYRYEEGYDQPNSLITRVEEVQIEGHWNSSGRILVRQVDPLPLGILAIAPDGYIPIGAP